jgi:hypothetical protein
MNAQALRALRKSRNARSGFAAALWRAVSDGAKVEKINFKTFMGYLNDADRWTVSQLEAFARGATTLDEMKRSIREKLLESYGNGLAPVIVGALVSML